MATFFYVDDKFSTFFKNHRFNKCILFAGPAHFNFLVSSQISITYMFQSDVRVLTMFSNEFVWPTELNKVLFYRYEHSCFRVLDTWRTFSKNGLAIKGFWRKAICRWSFERKSFEDRQKIFYVTYGQKLTILHSPRKNP